MEKSNMTKRQLKEMIIKILQENSNPRNINFVANKLSRLAHELHDYDFDVKNRKNQIQTLWNEVKNILNTIDPNEIIDAVKYKNESKIKENSKSKLDADDLEKMKYFIEKYLKGMDKTELRNRILNLSDGGHLWKLLVQHLGSVGGFSNDEIYSNYKDIVLNYVK